MLAIIFTIAMLVVFGKLFFIGIKLTWGILKFVGIIVFWPIILVALFAGGLGFLAFIGLIITGIISLICSPKVL